jgi:hypothetical protein
MTIAKRLALGAAVMAGVAACSHGDPVSNAGNPFGTATLLSGAPSNASIPNGSADVEVVYGGFDTSIRDAFSRISSDPDAARHSIYFYSKPSIQYWDFFRDQARNASPDIIDPRKPFIQSTTANVRAATDVVELYPPNPAGYPEADYWEVFTRFEGLKPSTQYQMVFVQNRLKVNGTLDQVERLLTGTVTQPDSLFPTPGTLQSINFNWVDACEGGPEHGGRDVNPFAVATFTSASTGVGPTLDKCWLPGSALWHDPEFDQQDKNLVGRNDDVGYRLPNYNYVELWEGGYGLHGGPVMRLQIAQDMDEFGLPVANGFAPFPAPNTSEWDGASGQFEPPLVDQLEEYPVPPEILATLKGGQATPSNVSATIHNLQRLAGSTVYMAWFINPTTKKGVPAVGTYTRKNAAGTVVETVSNTSTFLGGPGTITFDAVYDKTKPGAAISDSLQYFVITKETSASATTPNLSQPLWVRIFKIAPNTAGGTMTFGSFNFGAAVPFKAQGTATGGVLGDTIRTTVDSAGKQVTGLVFVGSQIELRFSGLQRPPVGYEYRGFLRHKLLLDASDPPKQVGDTALVDFGGLTGPNGESLDDVDVATTSANVTSTTLLISKHLFDTHTKTAGGKADQLCNYDRYRLYLLPKGFDPASAPVTLIFDIPLPGNVSGASIKECR